MPEDDLALILGDTGVPAEEADRLKRGGLYVDIGRLRERMLGNPQPGTPAA